MHSMTRLNTNHMNAIDNADSLHGSPCGIQIVGYSGQDEEVLMATEVIAEALLPLVTKT